jgi:hypothetical protein
MKRRDFLALASGLLLPVPERVREYSFVGGWDLPRDEKASDWSPASGEHLDRIAEKLFGVRRFPREADRALRNRIQERIVSPWLSLPPGVFT